MNPDITTQLKSLKRITPHPAYAARGRAMLLAAARPRVNPWRSLQWAGAFTFAMITLFIVATLSLPAEPTLSASLNESVLAGELESLPINIELRELTYRAATERTIQSAITEISGTDDAAHLNPEILSREATKLESENSPQERAIDTLLDRVLQ